MHMAIGAVVNAAWDLRSRLDRQPLWRLLASLSPQDIVRQIDFTYIDDALTASEALDILEAKAEGRGERIAVLEAEGLPAYTTSAGWLGYDDDKVARLARCSVGDGFTMLKLKVGADVVPTSAGWGSPDTPWASGHASPSTPTSGGVCARRSTGWRNWRSSTPTGSKSQPHLMTYSATSPSVERCAQFVSPRVSTSRTG